MKGRTGFQFCFFKVFNKCLLYGTCLFTRAVTGKFKDFQRPTLFSRTFKALNLEKIKVLSRTLEDAWEPCGYAHVFIVLSAVIVTVM